MPTYRTSGLQKIRMSKLLEITTLGQLKKTDYKSRSVKDELRANLIAQLQKSEGGFEGIIYSRSKAHSFR